MSRKFYAALVLTLSTVLIAGCGGAARSGSGGDLNSRVAQLEQRLNNIDTSGAASNWNDQETMRRDMDTLRNQMTDLNNRLDGSGRGGDLSAEVAVLKQRMDRLEAAMAQLQAQLGLNLEAMDTPIAEPTPLNQVGGATGAQYGGNAGVPTPMPPVDGYATPQPPIDQAGQAQTGAYGTVPQPPTGPTLNPDGTETVLINGVPMNLSPNPDGGAVATLDPTTGQPVAGTPPLPVAQTGGVDGSADPAKALYDSGTAAFNQRQYTNAVTIFTDFTNNYGSHALISNAWFWQGESYYQMEQYDRAALAYQEVITKYPQSNKMAAAMLKQGMSFEKIGNRNAANARYKELIAKYPNTPEATRAKALIR